MNQLHLCLFGSENRAQARAHSFTGKFIAGRNLARIPSLFFISTLQKLSPAHKILDVGCPKFIVKSLFLLRTVWVSANKKKTRLRRHQQDVYELFGNMFSSTPDREQIRIWTILTSVDLKSFANIEWRRIHKSWYSFAFVWDPHHPTTDLYSLLT